MEAELKSVSFSSSSESLPSSFREVCVTVWEKTEVNDNTGIWPRPLARIWTLMLLLATCLLYWTRMAMPLCAVTMAKQFGWNKMDSGMVLGSFFWGYCFTQVLGGHGSDKVGGERVLLLSTSSWAVITTITPLLATTGFSPLPSMILARFLMGVMQGAHYPSLASICAQRVAEGERWFLQSTLGCGTYLGMLMAGVIGSVMLESYGWESVFYVPGLLSALLAVFVWRCLHKGPAVTLDTSCTTSLITSKATSSKTCWFYLLTQPCVLAMILAHLCYSSSYFTLVSWLPTFFKDTYPHEKGWVFNVIPWFVAIPSSLFGGYLSDHLIRKGFQTVTVRKFMQFCSMGLVSIFMLLLCKTVIFIQALVFVSLALGLSTFHNSGVALNVYDLAPSCAGALYGIMNTCAAFTGLLIVYVSGYLIEVTGSWLNVFVLLSLVNIFGIVTFIIFGEVKRVDQVDQSQILSI